MTTKFNARHGLSVGSTPVDIVDSAGNVTATAIDNTPIGAITPSTGVFTTLTATGQTSLGGSAGSESFRAVNVASANRYILATAGVSGSTATSIGVSGGAGTLNLYASGNAGITFTTNGISTNEQFRVAATASAVNYVQVTGGATNIPPVVSAQGSDESSHLHLTGKGSGGVKTSTYFQVGYSYANYISLGGSNTGNPLSISAFGSDTNVPLLLKSKGTDGIDLAVGSSGINISNGDTVTNIYRTSTGSGYTSKPTVTISAPTTHGGVQATASVQMYASAATVQAGGTGYTINDVVTIVGGTSTGGSATFTVTAVSGGAITALTPLNYAPYDVLPSNPVSITGGTGTGATLNITYGIQTPVITNAGSGYVEQPTITFSGGGGSGAAAYATVGSNTTVKSLSSNLSFLTDVGEVLRVANNAGITSSPTYLTVMGGANGGVGLYASGGSTNASLNLVSRGVSSINFATNNTSANTQFLVANTPSAVNYIQITGGATNAAPAISAQGSDTNIELHYRTKGLWNHVFQNGSGKANFIISQTAGAAVVNRLEVAGALTGNSPTLSSTGSDTNIDLQLIPKGTGQVKAVNDTNSIIQSVGNNGYGAFTANSSTGSAYFFAYSGGSEVSRIDFNSSNSVLFKTSSAATEQFRVNHTASAVNYIQVTGNAANGAPYISSGGSDTNVSLGFTTKGNRGHIFSTAGTLTNLQFAVSHTASSANYIQVTGGPSAGAWPSVSVQGSDTNVGMEFFTKGTGAFRFNTSGAQQFRIADTSSAVNYVQVAGATTTNRPAVSAQGSDTDIGLVFVTKGSGAHSFASDNNTGTTQFRIARTASSVNYLQAAGAATNTEPVLSVQGSDTNISIAFQSKGTGAIDLAAGSSGVNISNGGTVTAITRTAAGSGYTSFPNVVISVPTTAGGVTATATVASMLAGNTTTVQSGGTGYTLNDTITISGGTPSGSAATYTVTGVSGGAITSVSALNFAAYTVLPSNPVSVTDGTGSGATLNLVWSLGSTFIITNAGSGYVEQPTVTFSGGGGSGAAAYATVGSGTTVKSIGSTMSFTTAGGEQVRVLNTNAANYMTLAGSGTGSAISLGPAGTDGGIATQIFSKGSGTVEFWTNGGNQRQMIVSHTASAVNYVQVTGAATGSTPAISAQGSDSAIPLNITAKGGQPVYLVNGSGNGLRVYGGTNYFNMAGSGAGSAPAISTIGTDTNIDLALTPKGTGVVKVNGGLTITGDLTVSGTTTTVNSTTLTVDDKNIELGSVDTPTDTTADGGGITLKGSTDKTIIWDSANNNWTSSENWNLATGKDYKINNVSVLNATTLGSSVTASSLTSVGTLTNLTVTNTITGSVSGNAATATTLQTARNINGVSFNGSADITITANTANSITFNNSGSGDASGTTFNGSAAKTISYNTVGAVGAVTQAGSNFDFNTIYPANPTFYRVVWNTGDGNMVNSPDGNSSGFLFSSQGSHDKWNGQFFLEQGATGDLFIRGSSDAGGVRSWGNWKTILDSTNYNNYSPTLTGTGATGTWGISITGNAATVTNGVYTNGSYADPAWITSINYSKLTGTVPTWNQNTTGSAAKWTTARTLSFTGDATGSGSVDGSANVATALTLANSGVTAGTYTKITVDAKGRATSGTILAASDIPNIDASKITTGVFDAARLPSYVDDVLEYTNLAGFPATGETGKIYVALDTNKTYRWSGSAYVYITSGAVDSVAGKTGVVTLVKGDVGLGNVDNTADANKNVLSATKLTTTRTISLTGDVTGSVSFDGSGNAAIATTIAADSVALGTDTTGNYVASVATTAPLSGGATGSEGGVLTLSLASGYGDTQNPYASKTANTFLAAPNGTAGTPTFRAIVAADIPTLNQNTTGTASNITAYTINQNLGTSNSPSFDQVLSTNNGNGTNFKVGDDAWIGDINTANTIRITGLQDATAGYIVFGNSNATALGRTGTGSLTYGGNALITAGDTGTVTSTMIADGTIVNADINASAAIAVSKLAASTISGVTLGSNLNTLTLNVSGTGLSGSTTYNGSAAATFTVTSNATNANTASTIVARDASGNFSAGTITATLSGNASTVTNGVYTTGSYSDPSWLTISKSKVGLGNVENTALSTWAGTTNITTIGAATASSLVVTGDLTVNGTTTTINSTTISVDDKNIELGSVAAPTNTTADGGGITLKGATDKTFNWINATGAWTSSEHIALAAGKDIFLSGATSGTVTLAAADVAGTTTITLPATTGTVITTGDTGTVTNTMLAGSIANAKLANSSVTVGTTAIALGASSTTLAGLTSVTSTSFVGALTGNASTVTNGVYTTGSYADPAWITSLAKSKVGLGNVENTALSTWAGSSNITTLGTIATGTWNATTIGTNKGGTGLTSFTANGAVYATSTSVLTTGTLPVASGGTGVTTSTGSGSVVLSTSPTLTTPNIGAATGTSLSVTGSLTSTVATGTAPLVVSSTTAVANLNADLLDGQHGSFYATSSHTHNGILHRGFTTDFNTALQEGGYGVGSGTSLSNAPYTGAIYGKLLVTVNDGGTHNNTDNWIWQVFNDTSGKRYTRYKVNATAWTTWVYESLGSVWQGTAAGETLATVTARGATATASLTIGTGGTYAAGSIYSDASWGMLFRAKQASPTQAEFRWSNSVDTELMRLTAAGNLTIPGTLYAASKSFLIPHPTKEGKKLRYGSLEGPENGVYVRGKLTGSNTIELPEYWTKLVDLDSITVQLTPVGQYQQLYVESIENNTVTVANETGAEINCFYVVFGERCDVEKLQVEVDNGN